MYKPHEQILSVKFSLILAFSETLFNIVSYVRGRERFQVHWDELVIAILN